MAIPDIGIWKNKICHFDIRVNKILDFDIPVKNTYLGFCHSGDHIRDFGL